MLHVFFLCVILVELVLIASYTYSNGEIGKWTFSVIAFVVVLIATINCNSKLVTECATEVVVEDYYYVNAEIIDIKENSNERYDVEFIVIDSHGVTHHWENESLMEDVPYMLTVKSNGTETVTDDEIVVVWKCTE